MDLKQHTFREGNFKKALKIAEQKKSASFFVFDLDSTLFCMKYRTQEIIRDCAKDKNFCEQFPNHVELIKKVNVTERDWSIEEILSRYGFSGEEPLVSELRKAWRKVFFSNDYLKFDKPYKGAVEFVQNIEQLGGEIFYLTARQHSSMREGSLKSLRDWKFPLKEESRLIMKKENETLDSEYKTNHLKELSKKCEIILFFENEPVILNKVACELPQAQLFWMDSTHSRREEPPKSAIPLSMDYVFET